MSKSKSEARRKLRQNAEGIIQELNAGNWDHVTAIHSKPIGEQHELAEELEKRSPGFHKEIYFDAIARAIWNNR